MQEITEVYHLRGGMDYEKTNPMRRAMMGMLVKSLRNKPENGLRVNFTDRMTIAPLVDAVKARADIR